MLSSSPLIRSSSFSSDIASSIQEQTSWFWLWKNQKFKPDLSRNQLIPPNAQEWLAYNSILRGNWCLKQPPYTHFTFTNFITELKAIGHKLSFTVESIHLRGQDVLKLLGFDYCRRVLNDLEIPKSNINSYFTQNHFNQLMQKGFSCKTIYICISNPVNLKNILAELNSNGPIWKIDEKHHDLWTTFNSASNEKIFVRIQPFSQLSSYLYLNLPEQIEDSPPSPSFTRYQQDIALDFFYALFGTAPFPQEEISSSTFPLQAFIHLEKMIQSSTPFIKLNSVYCVNSIFSHAEFLSRQNFPKGIVFFLQASLALLEIEDKLDEVQAAWKNLCLLRDDICKQELFYHLILSNIQEQLSFSNLISLLELGKCCFELGCPKKNGFISFSPDLFLHLRQQIIPSSLLLKRLEDQSQCGYLTHTAKCLELLFQYQTIKLSNYVQENVNFDSKVEEYLSVLTPVLCARKEKGLALLGHCLSTRYVKNQEQRWKNEQLFLSNHPDCLFEIPEPVLEAHFKRYSLINIQLAPKNYTGIYAKHLFKKYKIKIQNGEKVTKALSKNFLFLFHFLDAYQATQLACHLAKGKWLKKIQVWESLIQEKFLQLTPQQADIVIWKLMCSHQFNAQLEFLLNLFISSCFNPIQNFSLDLEAYLPNEESIQLSKSKAFSISPIGSSLPCSPSPVMESAYSPIISLFQDPKQGWEIQKDIFILKEINAFKKYYDHYSEEEKQQFILEYLYKFSSPHSKALINNDPLLLQEFSDQALSLYRKGIVIFRSILIDELFIQFFMSQVASFKTLPGSYLLGLWEKMIEFLDLSLPRLKESSYFLTKPPELILALTKLVLDIHPTKVDLIAQWMHWIDRNHFSSIINLLDDQHSEKILKLFNQNNVLNFQLEQILWILVNFEHQLTDTNRSLYLQSSCLFLDKFCKTPPSDIDVTPWINIFSTHLNIFKYEEQQNLKNNLQKWIKKCSPSSYLLPLCSAFLSQKQISYKEWTEMVSLSCYNSYLDPSGCDYIILWFLQTPETNQEETYRKTLSAQLLKKIAENKQPIKNQEISLVILLLKQGSELSFKAFKRIIYNLTQNNDLDELKPFFENFFKDQFPSLSSPREKWFECINYFLQVLPESKKTLQVILFPIFSLFYEFIHCPSPAQKNLLEKGILLSCKIPRPSPKLVNLLIEVFDPFMSIQAFKELILFLTKHIDQINTNELEKIFELMNIYSKKYPESLAYSTYFLKQMCEKKFDFFYFKNQIAALFQTSLIKHSDIWNWHILAQRFIHHPDYFTHTLLEVYLKKPKNHYFLNFDQFFSYFQFFTLLLSFEDTVLITSHIYEFDRLISKEKQQIFFILINQLLIKFNMLNQDIDLSITHCCMIKRFLDSALSISTFSLNDKEVKAILKKYGYFLCHLSLNDNPDLQRQCSENLKSYYQLLTKNFHRNNHFEIIEDIYRTIKNLENISTKSINIYNLNFINHFLGFLIDIINRLHSKQLTSVLFFTLNLINSVNPTDWNSYQSETYSLFETNISQLISKLVHHVQIGSKIKITNCNLSLKTYQDLLTLENSKDYDWMLPKEKLSIMRQIIHELPIFNPTSENSEIINAIHAVKASKLVRNHYSLILQNDCDTTKECMKSLFNWVSNLPIKILIRSYQGQPIYECFLNSIHVNPLEKQSQKRQALIQNYQQKMLTSLLHSVLYTVLKMKEEIEKNMQEQRKNSISSRATVCTNYIESHKETSNNIKNMLQTLIEFFKTFSKNQPESCLLNTLLQASLLMQTLEILSIFTDFNTHDSLLKFVEERVAIYLSTQKNQLPDRERDLFNELKNFYKSIVQGLKKVDGLLFQRMESIC